MAARKRNGLAETTRQRIKTSMLINRLIDHVVGKVEMTPSQVRSAEILLKKTLPDLCSMDIDAQVTDNKTVSAETMTVASWLAQHGEKTPEVGNGDNKPDTQVH